ncbi:MAG: Asp-tRNA(Asn)/Glu-tRNA(Gln) amidotransferase subunit GatC [Sulfolobales archaeon]
MKRIMSENELIDLVKRSIRLAMLEVDDRELETLMKEIKSLMNLVKKLDEIELEEVEPLFFVWERGGSLREDRVVDFGEEIFKWLEKSSRVENRFVKTPRTVEER